MVWPRPRPREEVLFLWGALLVLVAGGLGFGAFFARRYAGPAVPEPVARQLVPFRLSDTDGRSVTLEDFRGKTLVVNFVFSSCSLSCLQVNRHMAEIQKQVKDFTDVQLVSLTIDPRTDTPAVLGQFARRFTADTESWRFLTGDVRELNPLIERSFLGRANSLETPGGWDHTDQIFLVDATGTVRASYNGLHTGVVAQVIAALRHSRAVEGQP
jgi:protein SCO1/2